MTKVSQDRLAVYFSAGLLACAFTFGTWFFKNSESVNSSIKSYNYARPENCLLIDAKDWNGFEYVKFVDSTCRGIFNKVEYWNGQEWHSVDSNSKYFSIFRRIYNETLLETSQQRTK